MKRAIDIEALLDPIPGENPAGENLRYTPLYDDIQEARREDDALERGEWQREVKTADWDKVITLAAEVLRDKSKDLQIAVWLTEGLITTEGFEGLSAGLKILTGLLEDYWEHLYPQIEEEDLEFRAAPLEFMNDRVSIRIRQIPLTDERTAKGYSWFKWQESRQVGYETDTHNQFGDVDERKKNARHELIDEGKITAEEFDSAVALSSKDVYKSLMENVTLCNDQFKKLDDLVDEKFGSEAPRLAEFRAAFEDCRQVVGRLLKEKEKQEPTPKVEPVQESGGAELQKEVGQGANDMPPSPRSETLPASPIPAIPANHVPDAQSVEKGVWEEALQTLGTSGIKQALGQLFSASCSAPSVRERNRYRLLMAKLCLEAQRPDLARPIVEQLNGLIEELNLERWESPLWIGEVLDALYQCLTMGEPSDEDLQRSEELLQKLCTIDVTKAMIYTH